MELIFTMSMKLYFCLLFYFMDHASSSITVPAHHLEVICFPQFPQVFQHAEHCLHGWS